MPFLCSRPNGGTPVVPACAALLLLGLLSCVAPRFEPPDKPPHVLLIIGDDQAWTDFGFLGHPEIRTPHLDRLASQSLCFPRGYVPTPLCRPSLASMITGLYPHQHGITSNDPPKGTDRALMLDRIQAAPTLPRWLAQRGYVSFQSGKWWEGHHSLGGFTEGMTHGDPARGGRHGDDGLAIGRQGLEPIFDFIDGRGDAPFFVWYAPFLPHRPHDPPERLLARYQREGVSIHVARYRAMCEWFDETCGELLAGLEERGLAENTLVLFVTDNGWIQKADGGGYAPRSKRTPYEGGVRTPVLVRWPGRVEPRVDAWTLVTSLDLVPTVLDACGVEVGEELELPGRSLLVEGEQGVAGRRRVFGEVFTHDAVDLEDPAASLLHRWCIEGWDKVVVPGTGGRAVELYDLESDPHEEVDLADGRPERVRELVERVEGWWAVGGG